MLSLKFYFENPRILLGSIVRECNMLFTDKMYLQIQFYLKTKKILHLNNPTGFNEKTQWLKLYDRNPNYTKMVDKYAVKKYVADLIGEEYIIPTLGVWDSPDDIDYNNLPNRFVLKTTHGGGCVGVVVCKDKDSLDKSSVVKRLNMSLRQDIYRQLGEWPYKNVKKKIIAEKYLENENGELNDYKVLCFSGKAKLVEFHSDRFGDHHTQDFYDRDWNKTNITQGGIDTMSDKVTPRPSCLDKMIELSEILTKDMPLCRVDWYIVANQLYFGEITFYDASGFELFDNEKDELMLGSWIDLSLAYNGNNQ